MVHFLYAARAASPASTQLTSMDNSSSGLMHTVTRLALKYQKS